jgi:hypothetical protein
VAITQAIALHWRRSKPLAPDVRRFGPFGALPAAVGDIPLGHRRA